MQNKPADPRYEKRLGEEEQFLELEKRKIPKVRKVDSKTDRRSGKKYLRKPSLDDHMFSRAEILHQMLMEEFQYVTIKFSSH